MMMNPSVVNLQHRSVLELSVGLSRLIKGRHNGGVVYFGGSSKHCQYYLADHTLCLLMAGLPQPPFLPEVKN